MCESVNNNLYVNVCWWVCMVVRFVCVIRVPLCALVSRVCHLCVPAPPVSFYCTVPSGNYEPLLPHPALARKSMR